LRSDPAVNMAALPQVPDCAIFPGFVPNS